MKDVFSAESFKRDRSKGEHLVWFAGMWLSVGMMMITALLIVILVNGLVVFWPKAVVQVKVKENSESVLQGATTIAGEVRKRQVKSVNDAEGVTIAEKQLFIGNRDAYGLGFKFVTESDVVELGYPKDIILAERMEYGDLIGYPVRLEFTGGAKLEASSEEFEKRLHDEIKKTNARRAVINVIEKKRIGEINRQIDSEKLREKRAALQGQADESLIASVAAKTAELQGKYETLADEASALREEQSKVSFVYQLPTGQERSTPVGSLMGFYYPNQLTQLERVGHFFTEIWHFLVREPREANTEGGIFPAIFGTFIMTLLMSLAVAPFGVLAAIYLREYAVQGAFVRSVRIAVNNLAGVPSIVFGVFGLGFFVYVVGGSIDQLLFPERLPTPTYGTGGVLWAALTLALMTVPVVIVSTEEAIAAVPRGMKEASLASGASKWQTIQRIVLPASVPGIITGMILAMARGAGEVAPLMLVGVVKLAPTLPVDGISPFVHLERKFMHLGFHIYDLGFQSPDSDAAKPMVFATTLLLICLVVALNAFAIIIRERLRKRYATGAF